MTDAVPPFFIVGCGRSGTSLLRRQLNYHSQIAIPLESLCILDYLKAPERIALPHLVRMLVHEPEIADWGLQPRPADFADCTTISAAIDRLHKIYARQHHKEHWGNKTPRFIRGLELILAKFPTARFVHIVRDPRAVGNSLIRSEVHRSNAYYAARRWARDVGAGLAFESKYPASILRTTYENLVTAQEETMRSILMFLGFGFEPGVLAEHDANSSGEYSRFYANLHANLGRPVSGEFVTKWKDELALGDLETIEAICADSMDELGYVRVASRASIRKTRRLARASRVLGLFRQTYHYVRYRPKYVIYSIWRKWRLGLLRNLLSDINQ